MKRYISLLLITICFLLLPYNVSALEKQETKAETKVEITKNIKGYVIKADTLFTSKPNITLDSCLVKVNGKASTDYGAPGRLHCIDSAEEIEILNYDEIIVSTIDSCKTGFYKINAKDVKGETQTGYVCADNVKANIDVSKYKDEFTKAGFPESYFEKLTVLKEAHPNWVFTAYKTNLDWKEVVKNESIVGISYIQITNMDSQKQYISLDNGSYDPINKTYIVREGSNWYAANSSTVAYYLDPRNFLVEKEIFMFENLSYNSKYQTLEVVQNVLKNTDLYKYASTYIDAATYNGNSISPISLAASSRQEIVLGNGKLSGSADGTGKINDISYYNVYNLGANSSCINPVECAIKYASKRNWDTIEKSIKEGASEIARGYINQKQNTMYFKKFNVTSNTFGNYSNQYMTNVLAPKQEGVATYNAYSKIDGLLDNAIEFIIPVYNNMPDSASPLPTSVDKDTQTKIEDDAKKENEEQQSKIVDIINQAGYKYSNDYISNIKIGTSAGSLISKLKNNNEKVTIKITSIDSNNKTIEKKDSTVLGTGDIVNISNGTETKSFRIVIYGDVNGDGLVSAVDYVKIKNYIMSSSELSGSYKLAADVNNDGTISAVDYVNIKNYILGNNSSLK